MIYLILGEDIKLVLNKVNEIIKKEGVDEFDISKFEENANVNDLIFTVNMAPMLSEKRITLFKNPLFLTSDSTLDEKGEKLLIDLFNNQSFSNILILFGNIKLDKRKKLYKSIISNIRVIDEEKLDTSSFNNILNAKIKNLNLDLDSKAKDELVSRLPLDVLNLENELNKLVLLNKKITIDDVKALIIRPLDDDIFKLINAISEKKLQEAISLFRDLKTSGMDSVRIILTLANQIRVLLLVKILNSEGYLEKKIAETLAIHPYRVKLALKNYSYTINKLLKILDLLSQLDQDIKNGKINPDNGFELFILNLMR